MCYVSLMMSQIGVQDILVQMFYKPSLRIKMRVYGLILRIRVNEL